ncbi:Serpina7 [Phodopus roborovskii]|uniref:Thyroxine-binding globulin n=1 Tax=Phodopus roborovskii TaxID=109678 RepID=A0AAU9YYP2_PHORO|nr:Serpina7 [Phodopus roborovskii]
MCLHLEMGFSNHLHSRMSVFLCWFLLAFGLQDAIYCSQYNSSEGKVRTCHLPQQNPTLYKLSSINADFAFSLYRWFSAENPDWNIFFSPFLEVLGFNLTDTPMTELHQGFQHLICSLNFPKNDLELQMGNAIFIGKHLKPLAKFLDDVKTLYETEVFPTDFSNVSAAQKEINSYVEKQTKGKIIGLIQDLSLNIIMILVKYIHFKAQWANPFCVSRTEESSNFSVDNATSVQVPMMHQLEQYYHFVDIELNCTNALALFVLPKKEHLEWVEAAMSSKTLKKWNRLLQKGQIELFVPKFSISATYDHGSTLQKMGMSDAFAESANFPGITEDSGLKLSYAFHEAVLHIGEEGTKEGAVSLDRPQVALLHPIIQFDRPFLLMTLEKGTRSILFLGKVVNPVKE